VKLFFLFSLFALAAQAQRSAARIVGDLTAGQIEILGVTPGHDPTAQLIPVIIHVSDQDGRAYEGFSYKLQYKHPQYDQWLTYDRMEGIYDYRGSSSATLQFQVPKGYYRIWTQCLRSQTEGVMNFILYDQNNPNLQLSMRIPQRQYWRSDYRESVAERRRNKEKYDQQERAK